MCAYFIYTTEVKMHTKYFQFENAIQTVETFDNATNEMQIKYSVNAKNISGVVYKKSSCGLRKPL